MRICYKSILKDWLAWPRKMKIEVHMAVLQTHGRWGKVIGWRTMLARRKNEYEFL